MNMKYEEAGWNCKDFLLLSNELDEYLNGAIGGEEKREKYKGFNHLDTMDYVIIAYEESKPVGCGALRKYSEESMEIKRVFVREAYRKNGVAAEIMERLISKAREQGYQNMILETGEFLPASVRLYTRFGFKKIQNYGAYINMEESLCMGLSLTEIFYSESRKFLSDELNDLYKSVGWISAGYTERMTKAFQNAGMVISAWDGRKLIGLAEVLDDGELTAYIHYLLIRPEYQGRGIGRRLLELVKERYKNYLYLLVISEEKKNVEFYKRCGFKEEEQATVLKILTL